MFELNKKVLMALLRSSVSLATNLAAMNYV